MKQVLIFVLCTILTLSCCACGQDVGIIGSADGPMLGVLRIEMGNRLGLRDPFNFAPLWVVDFPLVEWDDETQRFYAMHHPFTAPKPEHLELFYSDKKEDLEKVCANAYDFVLNGTELGGGSIRIHEAAMQERMFEVLGISKEDAEYKFGFIWVFLKSEILCAGNRPFIAENFHFKAMSRKRYMDDD